MKVNQLLKKLFSPLHDSTVAIIHLCKILKVPATRTYIQQLLEDHPDYPSLLSISDVLKNYGVENIAVKTELKKFNELSLPLIAQISLVDNRKRDKYFTLVTDYSNEKISFIHPLDEKEFTISEEAFKEIFLDYVLLAEANESAGEKTLQKNRNIGAFIRFRNISQIGPDSFNYLRSSESYLISHQWNNSYGNCFNNRRILLQKTNIAFTKTAFFRRK